MSVDSFLDTNVLVYAAAGRGAEEEEEKRRQALELVELENFGISAQVLQEFYVTVTRKIKVALSAAAALEWIEQLEVFPCQTIDSTLVKIAVETSVRYRISYWDASIVAAAEQLGASTLYTEDLNHGQCYGRVQACNPFLS